MRAIIAVIGILASIAGIYTFVTGQNLAPTILGEQESAWLQRYEGRWNSPEWEMEIVGDGAKEFSGELNMKNPEKANGLRYASYSIIGEIDGPVAKVSVWDGGGRKILQRTPVQLTDDSLYLNWVGDGVTFKRAD